MTAQETMQKAGELKAQADRALSMHGLAMQAFAIACARADWETAQKEHYAALDHLDAYLNAMAALNRVIHDAEPKPAA